MYVIRDIKCAHLSLSKSVGCSCLFIVYSYFFLFSSVSLLFCISYVNIHLYWCGVIKLIETTQVQSSLYLHVHVVFWGNWAGDSKWQALLFSACFLEKRTLKEFLHLHQNRVRFGLSAADGVTVHLSVEHIVVSPHLQR